RRRTRTQGRRASRFRSGTNDLNRGANGDDADDEPVKRFQVVGAREGGASEPERRSGGDEENDGEAVCELHFAEELHRVHTRALVSARPHTDTNRARAPQRPSMATPTASAARPAIAAVFAPSDPPRDQADGATVTAHAYKPGTLACAAAPIAPSVAKSGRGG